jgi:hypothetical protein
MSSIYIQIALVYIESLFIIASSVSTMLESLARVLILYNYITQIKKIICDLLFFLNKTNRWIVVIKLSYLVHVIIKLKRIN